ncbi:MAG: response regulator [Rhodospirillales bacterium]|nr:response regulator [Alphaproteobacteria bacterium]MBL6947708.1 response regulator [Rhodospirillales bacterium]
MGTFDFSRLGVFVIEDNSYLRQTLEDLLRYFQFGRVATAKDGEEAIDYMKTLGSAGSIIAPDIIISDLVMSPINGLLFLRWTRTAKESSNRMVPFIMLSGAADEAYVNSARDLGCTEFLAKPFSAGSVYNHLLKVIEQPRQFVTTTKYFGPDRRRKKLEAPGKERRLKDDAEVTIVYSQDKVVKPEAPSDVWYFRLPNTLKEKAGGAGFKGAAQMPVELLEEAEQQLERAALDFTTWARDYVARLGSLCSQALESDVEGGRGKFFGEINLLALELRGQGGTFGYPLISTFGKMLYDATTEGCREDDHAVEIVKAHIDAMGAVLREKVSGDGGKIGRALLASLKKAIETKEDIVE